VIGFGVHGLTEPNQGLYQKQPGQVTRLKKSSAVLFRQVTFVLSCILLWAVSPLLIGILTVPKYGQLFNYWSVYLLGEISVLGHLKPPPDLESSMLCCCFSRGCGDDITPVYLEQLCNIYIVGGVFNFL